jgi:hypothetical protein
MSKLPQSGRGVNPGGPNAPACVRRTGWMCRCAHVTEPQLSYPEGSPAAFPLASHKAQEEVAPMRIAGFVLIVIGVISLALGGISYTKREKVIDLGPIQATADRQKTIPLPPLLGGLALVGGVALLIASAKKR